MVNKKVFPIRTAFIITLWVNFQFLSATWISTNDCFWTQCSGEPQKCPIGFKSEISKPCLPCRLQRKGIVRTKLQCCRKSDSIITPALILHGGADSFDDDLVRRKKKGMLEAIRIGYEILLRTDNPLDAIEKTVNSLENNSAFDAGYGSVQTASGEIEMDAIIINGTDLSAGAVGAVRHVANPVSLARIIKDRTPHVLLVGRAAEKYAASQGIPLVPTEQLIAHDNARLKSSSRNLGTVGAIAINSKGHIAASTSTGGLEGKLDGRVGDSPIIGGGTLADDESCGVSSTGIGEDFMRFRVATKIETAIINGMKPTDAVRTVLKAMTKRIPGAEGGSIVITKDGSIGYEWNSKQMAWAYAKDKIIHYGVNRGEDITQIYN